MHTGCSCKSYNTAWFYVAHLDHFKAIIISIILLVLPLSSNIVDFILPGWCQIYIATAHNWPATWQTRPTETSVIIVHCTCTPCFKLCTPTFKILPNTMRPFPHCNGNKDSITESFSGKHNNNIIVSMWPTMLPSPTL